MSNLGNINYKTVLEVKVSLLAKENFELRGQLIDKMLIIKQLKTNSKSNPFTTDASTITNTITAPPQTYETSTAILIITTVTITTTVSTAITVKTATTTTTTTTITRS